ncbi:unnamed protein product [Lota lota]
MRRQWAVVTSEGLIDGVKAPPGLSAPSHWLSHLTWPDLGPAAQLSVPQAEIKVLVLADPAGPWDGAPWQLLSRNSPSMGSWGGREEEEEGGSMHGSMGSDVVVVNSLYDGCPARPIMAQLEPKQEEEKEKPAPALTISPVSSANSPAAGGMSPGLTL